MKKLCKTMLLWRWWTFLGGGVQIFLTQPSFKTAFGALAGLTLFVSGACGQMVYAMQFNQSANLFGTINLLNGSFTGLGSEGSTLFNDIAAAPNGTLYGIINTAQLATINPANGAVLTSVPFNVNGIESLAVSADGTLYGATQSALYTINSSNGRATLIGNFNNSLIGSSGQNIRFAFDGNLYDTDAGVNATNTDLFRISTADGAATLMGVITNFPGLCLENAGNQMYGAGIQLGSASTLAQDLVGIDLSTLESGGTNADGSPVDIRYHLLTANFPNNYNFSSSISFIVSVPEPNAIVFSLMGGVIFLTISHVHRRR